MGRRRREFIANNDPRVGQGESRHNEEGHPGMERVFKPLERSFRVLHCLSQCLQRFMLFFSDILFVCTGFF